MQKWRPVIILATLLLASMASGQGEPNRQTGLSVDRNINAIDIAVDDGSFVAVTNDVGATSSDTDAPVWFYWGSDGRNLLQDGSADAEDCGTIVSADCYSDATHVAVDANGDRMVVASELDSQSSSVLFISTAAGPQHQETITGSVTGLAISDDGQTVVASTSRTINDDGRVVRFSWGTAIDKWEDNTDDPATAVDVSSDGKSIAAAAGPHHHRYHVSAASTLVADTKFPGSVTDVQVSGDANTVSIAGSSTGYFVIYDDDTSADNRVLRVRDLTTAISAVAITEDAKHVAIGNTAGNVWIYELNTQIRGLGNGGSPVSSWQMQSAVEDLDFSRDGRYLGVAAGNVLSMHEVHADGAIPLWQDTLEGSIGAIRLSATGDRIIAAASTETGHEVFRYQAKHAITVAGPTQRTLLPEQSVAVSLNVTNAGNRPETVSWTVVGASGIGVDAIAAASVHPGDHATFTTTVSVPASYAPGTHTITLNATTQHGLKESHPLNIVVPEVRAWRLEAGEHPVSLGAQLGQPTTFKLDLANIGNVEEPAPVTVGVDLDGWTAAIKAGGTLPPGGEGLLVIEVTSPDDVAEGVAAQIDVTLEGEEPIELLATVGARFGVDMTAPAGLEIHPGVPGSVVVSVTNTGNAVDGVRLKALGVPSGWSIQFSGSASHVISQIEAGETVDVPVTVTAPFDAATGGAPSQVFFQAASLADSGRTSTSDVLISVTEPPVVEEEPEEPSLPTPGIGAGLALVGLLGAARWRRQ